MPLGKPTSIRYGRLINFIYACLSLRTRTIRAEFGSRILDESSDTSQPIVRQSGKHLRIVKCQDGFSIRVGSLNSCLRVKELNDSGTTVIQNLNRQCQCCHHAATLCNTGDGLTSLTSFHASYTSVASEAYHRYIDFLSVYKISLANSVS